MDKEIVEDTKKSASLLKKIRKTDFVFRLLEKISDNFLSLFFIFAIFNFLYYFSIAALAGRLGNVAFVTDPENISTANASQLIELENNGKLEFIVYDSADLTTFDRFWKFPIDQEIATKSLPIVGFLEDYGEFFFFLISQPVSLGALVWQSHKISEILNHFKKNKLIRGLNERGERKIRKHRSFEAQVESLEKWLSNKWFVYLLIVIFIFINVAYYIPGPVSEEVVKWRFSLPPSLRFLELLHADLVYYSVFTLGWRAVVFTAWVTRLFLNFDVDIHPSHSDKTGGYGSLGSYLSKVGYIIGVFGVAIILGFLINENTWLTDTGEIDFVIGLGQSLTHSLTIPIYMIAVPLVFFPPLFFGHLAMRKNKEFELQRLSRAYNKQYKSAMNIVDRIENEDAKELQNATEILTGLKILEEKISELPEWPSRLSYFIRYIVSSVLVPIGLALLIAFIEVIILGD